MRFRSKKAVVLGGILLGDTFRLNSWIEEKSKGEGLVAFSSNYNKEAIEVFRQDTDLPIIQNITLEHEVVHFDWNDFVSFSKLFQAKNLDRKFNQVYYPTLDDLHHSLTSFRYRSPNFDISLPDRFIAVQPITHLVFKNQPSLFKVRFPLPIVNLGSKNDSFYISGSQVENGRSLRESIFILSQSTLVVGIDSVLSQVAAQIGKPSIKIHFGSWEFDHRSIRELKIGIDLYRPSVSLIEDVIGKALELIEKRKETELWKLSRKN